MNVIAMALLVIGGLNCLLMGLFSLDLVAGLFGGGVGPHSTLSRIVCIIAGIAAIHGLYLFKPITENHHDRRPRTRA